MNQGLQRRRTEERDRGDVDPLETLRRDAADGNQLAVQHDVLVHDVAIGAKNPRPQGVGEDDGGRSADRFAGRWRETTAERGRHLQHLEVVAADDRTLNFFRDVSGERDPPRLGERHDAGQRPRAVAVGAVLGKREQGSRTVDPASLDALEVLVDRDQVGGRRRRQLPQRHVADHRERSRY